MQLSQIKQNAKAPIREDWGSSDWYPVMLSMHQLIERHYDKKYEDDTAVMAAAKDLAGRYMEDMGYDDEDDCAASIAAMFKRRFKAGHIKIKEELLAEGYEERVEAAVKHLVSTFSDKPATREGVLSALHTYASRGVPDYNGKRATKNEYVRDVLAGLKGKIKYAVKAPAGGYKPKKDNEYYSKIWNKVESAISNSFPDGDPIDYLIPWMRRNDIEMKDIDIAARKHSGSKSYNDYLADMWDDLAADAMADAAHGHTDEHSPYFDMEDGKPVMRQNPWTSSTEHNTRQAKRAKDRETAAKKLHAAKTKHAAADADAIGPVNDELEEGVLGSDHREKAEYPAGKFDYNAWKKGKGPTPQRREVDKKPAGPDSSRFFNSDGSLKTESK